jgi:hypothetical protein
MNWKIGIRVEISDVGVGGIENFGHVMVTLTDEDGLPAIRQEPIL